jgi:two-component system sensor histidine kinase/response regulator
LRNDERTKEIPVIFLTAKTEKGDIVKGFEAGGQDYVTKPFDVHELMERVKTHLELKNQREILKNMNEILEEKVKERTAQLEEANAELDKANKELQGLDIAKNNFLWLISHEIRTPLNGISGAAILLHETLGKDHEFGEFVNMLKVSADRLEKFSLTALVITQLHASNHKLVKSKVQLDELVNTSLDTLQSFAEVKNVKIASELTDSGIELMAEKDMVSRAIDSVIHNAIKYSPENGLVTVKVSKKIGRAFVDVYDQGKGFSENALKNLFQPFGIGEEHIDKNVGLSLKATKMIMDAHQGEIIVNNIPGSGVQVQLIFNLEE